MSHLVTDLPLWKPTFKVPEGTEVRRGRIPGFNKVQVAIVSRNKDGSVRRHVCADYDVFNAAGVEAALRNLAL